MSRLHNPAQVVKRTGAGAAFAGLMQDDPGTQAAWRCTQAGLLAFGVAARIVLEPVDKARDVAASALSKSMRVYRELGGALGDTLNGEFDRLWALVEHYPELKQTADELEQAVRERRQIDEQRRADIEQRVEHITAALTDLRDPRAMMPPAFDDPNFWSSIRPIGEQFRDVVHEGVREALQEQTGGKRGRVSVSVKDVAAQLRRYAAAGGPYLDQRTFCKLCGCKSTSTVSKAIAGDDELTRWKDSAMQARKAKATPRRDAGDFDIVTEQVAAKPEHTISQEDVDTIMRKLHRQAEENPEWGRELGNMSSDRRVKIAQLYADGDYEPSSLEDDRRGKQLRKVKYHGRV